MTATDDQGSQSARCMIEVTAGVVPGIAQAELTKSYWISSAAWELSQSSETVHELLSETLGKAQGYAMYLMLQPDRFNWVRTDWIWF